jgi:prolyl-tRNA editing enzyme YbaK/EbsC (Cys-tRNA(Pro) deacylase)
MCQIAVCVLRETDVVNRTRLAVALGTESRLLRLAEPDAAHALTGFRVGSIPPFAHSTLMPVVLDEGLLSSVDTGAIVVAGGGAPR